jgi:hypothetical protein
MGGSGRGLVEALSRLYTEETEGNTKKKTLIEVVGVSSELRTKNLLNVNEKRYRFSHSPTYD